MTYTMQSIEDSITSMDLVYDANFGEWIRNEQNCKVVGHTIRKFIGAYSDAKFITVVKWIVKDWTLKSIIALSRKMATEELFRTQNEPLFSHKTNIISGMIYTWNSLFIAEFLTATSERYSPDEKCNYYHAVLGPFDRNKLSEILLQIEPKLDEETKEKLVNKFNKNSNKNKGSRTGSILDAMNLM